MEPRTCKVQRAEVKSRVWRPKVETQDRHPRTCKSQVTQSSWMEALMEKLRWG